MAYIRLSLYLCHQQTKSVIKMRTQVSKIFLILSLSAFFLIGCTPKTKQSTENNIKFDSITVEKTYHLFENPENPNCNLQIKFIYPVKFSNNEILKKIQAQFVLGYFGENYEALAPQEAVNSYTEEYLKSYKELEADFKEELEKSEAGEGPVGSWFSYYESSNNEIIYNQNDILSYTIYFENYTGGAHGAHSTTNHVLNLKNGTIITEEDIFVEDFHDSLAQMLVNQIAKQNDVSNIKDLENIGFFSVDEITPNGNFLVDENGITYSFNEYEIAAYVVGVTNVHLPYENIRHLLKPESPISHLY